MSILDHIHKGASPAVVNIPLLDAIKENPVGNISEGYVKTRPAPFELGYLVTKLKCHPLAFDCIRRISSQAGQARLIAYNSDGTVNDDYTRLLDQPNPDYSGTDMRQMAYMSLAGLGNFALTAFRNGLGAPAELWPNRIDRMEYKLNGKGGISHWNYKLGGKEQRLAREDVLHVRHQWIDMEQFGCSTAAINAANLKYHDGYNDWNNRILDGAQGISEIYALDSGAEDRITPEQAKEIFNTFNRFKLNANMGMTGARALVNAKIKSLSRGVNPQELQAWEWFDRLTKGILNSFGIPPILYDIGNGATFENQKEARASFWEDTLLPLYVYLFADALTRFFPEGIVVKPDLDNVPALAHRRMEMWKCVDGLNSKTINEKRALMGDPPIDGGDVLFMDANKLPLGFDLGVEPTEEQIERSVKQAAKAIGLKLVK